MLGCNSLNPGLAFCPVCIGDSCWVVPNLHQQLLWVQHIVQNGKHLVYFLIHFFFKKMSWFFYWKISRMGSKEKKNKMHTPWKMNYLPPLPFKDPSSCCECDSIFMSCWNLPHKTSDNRLRFTHIHMVLLQCSNEWINEYWAISSIPTLRKSH